ncbi:MAG: hypothetical protein JW958_04435 [Candidatus Eisenbacteria bacterium]|nr:hypothetical protein [Candidatus Eisenbacteria bacterium]
MFRPALFPILLFFFVARAFAAADETPPDPERTGPRLRAPSAYTGWLLRDARLRLTPPEERKEPAETETTRSPTTLSFNRFGAYPVEQLYRPRVYELSRFQCTMKGLGAGAQTGLFLGILANALSGSDDYRNAWYMAGAMAATGAILGGTIGANDPGWSVGIDWSTDRRRPGDGLE